MGYRLDLTTGKCSSRPLNESFVPFGVPSEAKFGNIDYLGAELPGLGLKVDSFHEKFGILLYYIYAKKIQCKKLLYSGCYALF